MNHIPEHTPSSSAHGSPAKPHVQLPADARGAAAFYLKRGYLPLPIPRRGRAKAPVMDDWPNLRPTLHDLDHLFPLGEVLNLGLLLGAPSGGLIDIDLDTPEAVAAASVLLPATGWISGRSGSPRSHWWYVVAEPPERAADEYRDIDPEKTMLLELRSTGGQTVVPPGIHESGEPITWYAFTEPATTAWQCWQGAAQSRIHMAWFQNRSNATAEAACPRY